MTNRKKVFFPVAAVAVFIMLLAARPALSAPNMVQITREVPVSAAASIPSAGFDSVLIYYTPYRKADDPATLAHLKAWGAQTAKKGFGLYVRIETGPPLDVVSDAATMRFHKAAEADGYPMDHKPAPAHPDFWKTAIFPKIDTLAQFPLKGIFISFDRHVRASYDIDTFTEFLKTKDPSVAPASIGAQQRRPYLSDHNLVDEYEKYQEDKIYELFKDYFMGLKSRAPGLEIGLASYEDNPLHKGVLRALREVWPRPVTILYTFHTPADMEKRPVADAVWLPALSVRDFPPSELAAMIGGLNLWKSGFLVSDAETLWSDLRNVNINNWPLGTASEYLRAVAASKKADPARMMSLVNQLSARVTVDHSGAPRVGLIYSGYNGYMYRDVFDAPMAKVGITLKKFENAKLDKFVSNTSEIDALFAAPGYNAVKSDKFQQYAKDVLKYVSDGGLLFILDGSTPALVDWLGQADPQLKLSVEQKSGLAPKWTDTGFKMLGYPVNIKTLPVGKAHFIDVAAGWRAVAKDNEDKPYIVQRIYGAGMIVAQANFDVNEDFLVGVWEYMLKVKDRFEVLQDPNMPPIGIGHNEVRFVAKTIGPERHLKIKTDVLDERGGFQTSERRTTLSAEGGARFTVPLEAKHAGLYRLTMTFFDEDRNRVDRRETYAFMAPEPIEVMTDKSYYTSESAAMVRVACRRIAGCGAIKADITLTGKDGKSAVKVKPQRTESGALYFTAPIATLKPGDFRITASVSEPTQPKATYSVALKKLSPGPVVETKFLHFRGDLTEVNGKPYFPLGIYSIPPENLQELADSGVNGMIYYGSTVQSEADINTALEGKGIRFAAYPLSPQDRILKEDRAALLKEIEDKSKNKNMFMWYLADEPELFGQSPELIYDVYSFVNKIDPYRPQAIVMMSPPEYARYVHAADIFMFDHYPTPAGPLNSVGIHAQRAIQAVYGRKPVFAIPQAFSWAVWGDTYKEGQEHRPNYTEMRSSAIQSIAAGVKGVIFWAFTASRYDMRKFPNHVIAFKRLMTELSGVMDAIEEPNAYVDISVAPDFKGIDWGAKIHDGKLYMFTYNGDAAVRSRITFTLPEKYTGGTVEVHGENRTLSMQGRRFTDDYDVLASHIYIVKGK